jgi:hypothetical protein
MLDGEWDRARFIKQRDDPPYERCYWGRTKKTIKEMKKKLQEREAMRKSGRDDTDLTEIKTQCIALAYLIAPIRYLPNEILEEMFLYTTIGDDFWDLPRTVTVMLVCHHWKKVALNSPSLWTRFATISSVLRVPLYGIGHRIRQWVSRSGDLPLDVGIVTFDGHPPDKEWSKTLLPLTKEFARWRSLRLNALEPLSYLSYIIRFSVKASRTDTREAGEPASDSSPSRTSSQDLSLLTSMTLVSNMQGLSTGERFRVRFTAPNLTTLSLETIDYFPCRAYFQLVAVTPNVRYLTFKDVQWTFEQETGLSSPNPDITENCNKVGHSKLEYLNFAIDIADDEDTPDILIPIFKGIASYSVHLHELEIHSVTGIESFWEQHFKLPQFPSVASLRIFHPTMDATNLLHETQNLEHFLSLFKGLHYLAVTVELSLSGGIDIDNADEATLALDTDYVVSWCQWVIVACALRQCPSLVVLELRQLPGLERDGFLQQFRQRILDAQSSSFEGLGADVEVRLPHDIFRGSDYWQYTFGIGKLECLFVGSKNHPPPDPVPDPSEPSWAKYGPVF